MEKIQRIDDYVLHHEGAEVSANEADGGRRLTFAVDDALWVIDLSPESLKLFVGAVAPFTAAAALVADQPSTKKPKWMPRQVVAHLKEWALGGDHGFTEEHFPGGTGSGHVRLAIRQEHDRDHAGMPCDTGSLEIPGILALIAAADPAGAEAAAAIAGTAGPAAGNEPAAVSTGEADGISARGEDGGPVLYKSLTTAARRKRNKDIWAWAQAGLGEPYGIRPGEVSRQGIMPKAVWQLHDRYLLDHVS